MIGMQRVEQTTKNTKNIVVQSTKICNYGRVSYNLDNAKQGVSGYTLTETFKNAVRNLPSSYDAVEYTQFIDSWGTVSQLYFHNFCTVFSLLYLAMHICIY